MIHPDDSGHGTLDEAGELPRSPGTALYGIRGVRIAQGSRDGEVQNWYHGVGVGESHDRTIDRGAGADRIVMILHIHEGALSGHFQGANYKRSWQEVHPNKRGRRADNQQPADKQ